MMPSVAVQIALRARLVGASAVVAIVPPAQILDAHKRPLGYPLIVLGEGQAVEDGGDLGRLRTRVYSDLHLWIAEPSFETAAALAGAVHRALHSPRLELAAPFMCADCLVRGARFMRDPGGELSHVVMSVETLVHGVAA